MTAGSEIVSATAMTTSVSITAIVIIIIASAGGIKLSTVALVLAPVIVLLSPSPGQPKHKTSAHFSSLWSSNSMRYLINLILGNNTNELKFAIILGAIFISN